MVHRAGVVDGFAGAFGGPVGARLVRERILHVLVRNGLVAMDGRSPLRRGVTRAAFEGRWDVLNLSPAGLAGARLDGALLQHAKLRGANVSTASFVGAHCYRTVCPNGSITNDQGDSCAALVDRRATAFDANAPRSP